MKNLHIIKIGGNVLDDAGILDKFLYELARLPGHKILVHGGGKLATDLATKLKIETKIVDGRRITDEETLKVATMVYAGWINKSLVARLQANNCKAIGLSGADGGSIIARKRPVGEIDYGFVGDILPSQINTDFFQNQLEFGLTPVVSPITCDAKGNLLNTNADTIAATLAVSLSDHYQARLIYCFEKKGVLSNPKNEGSVISTIDPSKYELLKNEKIISKGMIPKLDNAFKAKQEGVDTVVIGHASELLNLIHAQQHAGTHIHS